MSFFNRDLVCTQTTWGSYGGNQTWVANIDADIQDQKVIEQAKLIVDYCSPQRYGPHGTHAYSFLKREYVLNLLLFHYADYGFFPSGYICITDEWLYSTSIKTTGGTWFCFQPKKKAAIIRPAGGSKSQPLLKSMAVAHHLSLQVLIINLFPTIKRYWRSYA